MYNVSNIGSAHQEQQPQQASSSTSTDLDNPNKKDDLKENLKDDQLALKRMIMILSLVGGLGVIAVVATIVIFTRMRVKNRKQREIDEEGNEGSTFELSANVDRQSNSNTSESDNNDDNEGRGGQGILSTSTPTSNLSISSTSSSLANGRTLTEPSAPPALMMIDGLEPLHRNRRNIVSIISQTAAPSPSAPTAKELDAMEEDNSNVATTSTPYNHHILHHGHHHHQQEQINNCSRCTPLMMAPELPPPAYTPSAPPHYALPIEANVMEASPSSSSSSNMSPLPSRRHSLGG